MRRISLAVALLGACALAGCSSGVKPTASNGNQKGVQGKYYYVNLFSTPVGGLIQSTAPAALGIDCGASKVGTVKDANGDLQYAPTYYTGSDKCGQFQVLWTDEVTLTAVPQGGNTFLGWAGDCSGYGDCTLKAGNDKTVVAIFAALDAQGRATGHPSFVDPATHSAAWGQFNSGDTGGLQCNTCHGADLKGMSIAPSCAACHSFPLASGVRDNPVGGHGDNLAPPWEDDGGWSQACTRCHTSGGFRDYIGVDGKPNNSAFSFNPTNNLGGGLSTDVADITNPDLVGTGANTGKFMPGALKCDACHNTTADALTTIYFPSLKTVTTNNVNALCGTCHQARQSTASLNSTITSSVAAKGLGSTSISASSVSTDGTSLNKTGLTASAFKGNVCIFAGNKTPALNGVQVTVSDNTTTAITFVTAAPATPANGETMVCYPTASAGGSTTKLVDAGRNWTADAFKNFYVYFQTGANAGLYRLVTANDATSLTLDGALPAAPVAGDFYVIAQAESAAALDAQLTANNKLVNSHYLGAAATVFGRDAAGWYQYPRSATATISKAYAVYTGTNQHGVTAGKCTSCHDPHGLNVVTVTKTSCGRCHFKADGSPVASLTELEETRQYGFEGNIDGKGTESLKAAIDDNAQTLLKAMQAYATNVVGTSICFTLNGGGGNYYFIDTNADGTCDTATETTGYNKFTPRLLRAAYNYNFYMHEPGAWAHNPRYVNELLYDGIVDLNAGLTAAGKATVPFAGFRAFNDHFGAANAKSNPNGGDQFRDWDAAVVPNNCSQCHAGAKGFANAIANTLTTVTNKPIMAMECTTCHAPKAGDANMQTIRSDVAQVWFPPAKDNTATPNPKAVAIDATTLPESFALCGTCHSGRENTTTIDIAIAGMADQSAFSVSFKNPHYLGAAGIILGAKTHMAYEYVDQVYVTTPVNFGVANNGNAPGPHGSPHGASCTGCHRPMETSHSFEVDDLTLTTYCGSCHVKATYGDFRLQPKKDNVQAMAAKLYATLTAYTQAKSNPACYNGAAYPYWYKDDGSGGGTANDGVCQTGETAQAKFDAKSLKATFNYKWSQAEPGAYAHNYEYIIQVLFDSIKDLDPAATMPLDAADGLTPIARP